MQRMIVNARPAPAIPTLYHPSAPQDDELLDFGALVTSLKESRRLLLGMFFLAVLGGMAYVFLVAPVYESDVLLQVSDKNSAVSPLQDASGLLGGDNPVADDIEILKSRLILSQAVQGLGQDIVVRPHYLPVIGAAIARRHEGGESVAPPWFGLRDFSWGGERLRVVAIELPEPFLGHPFTLVAGEAVADEAMGFELFTAENALVLSGTVGQWSEGALPDGSIMKLFVAQLRGRTGSRFTVTRLPLNESIDDLRERMYIEERGAGSGILRVTLQGPDPRVLKDTLNKIAGIYVAHDKQRNVAEIQRTLKFLESQLPMLKAELAGAEDALNSYRSEQGSIDLASESQAILQRIVGVEGQKSELARTRFELIQVYTPQHPKVRAVDAQLASLERELRAFESKVRALPGTQQEVLRLSRDAEVNTQLYSVLLNKIQELKIILAGTTGGVDILDTSVLPYEPVEPRPLMVIAGTLFAGMFLGIGAALGRRMLGGGGGGVVDPQIVERRLGVPVCAVVPHSAQQTKLERSIKRKASGPALLASSTPGDLAVESLRGLRTRIDYMLEEAATKIVLVTGPRPGVGKTFVSCNLGAVLASTGKKVLLVDADLRSGHIHKYFGFDRMTGLSDYLAEMASIEQVTYATPVRNLHLIPSGRVLPNPSELLLRKLFSSTLRAASAEYDYIVVDSPPVLGVTDAEIIGQFADAALMVLKAGEHSLREIEQTAKTLTHSGVQLYGTVFNDMDVLKKHAEYGQYYGYQSAYPMKPLKEEPVRDLGPPKPSDGKPPQSDGKPPQS